MIDVEIYEHCSTFPECNAAQRDYIYATATLGVSKVEVDVVVEVVEVVSLLSSKIFILTI